MPVSLATRLGKRGVDTDTVLSDGLGGHSDAHVLAAARETGRMIFTLDRGFGDIRSYPPGSHPGIVVFRLDDQSGPAVIESAERLMDHHNLEDLAGTVTSSTGDYSGSEGWGFESLRAREGPLNWQDDGSCAF
jgi:predicted nuclease of predicted toxin-antitoxin system